MRFRRGEGQCQRQGGRKPGRAVAEISVHESPWPSLPTASILQLRRKERGHRLDHLFPGRTLLPLLVTDLPGPAQVGLEDALEALREGVVVDIEVGLVVEAEGAVVE